MVARCRENPACRNGRKAPRRSAEATGRSQRFPQKSEGLEDWVKGESEKDSIVRPVHMDVSNPSPEVPPVGIGMSHEMVVSILLYIQPTILDPKKVLTIKDETCHRCHEKGIQNVSPVVQVNEAVYGALRSNTVAEGY
jgi:hypothetical protein